MKVKLTWSEWLSIQIPIWLLITLEIIYHV